MENPICLIKEPRHLAEASSDHSELIVIDAGHGGHDTGAIVGGKKEKDVVLQIAKKLEKELKERGHPVYMTRTTDRFLKLPQRTKIADQKQSVAFISIHANSVSKKSNIKFMVLKPSSCKKQEMPDLSVLQKEKTDQYLRVQPN